MSARAAALAVTLPIAVTLVGLVALNAASVDRGARATGSGVMAAIISVVVVAGLFASPSVAVILTALMLAALVAWKVVRFGGPPPPADVAVIGRG